MRYAPRHGRTTRGPHSHHLAVGVVLDERRRIPGKLEQCQLLHHRGCQAHEERFDRGVCPFAPEHHGPAAVAARAHLAFDGEDDGWGQAVVGRKLLCMPLAEGLEFVGMSW